MRSQFTVLALVAGLCFACSGGEPTGGGDAGGAGGFGGSSGTGGVANTGGAGGNSEGGSGQAGSGGTDGSGGLGWLDEDAVWRDLPASSDEAHVRVRESVAGALRFPALGWSSCGPGCETVELTTGDELWGATLGKVASATGSHVVVSFLQPRPGYLFRRFVDLRSGETTMALRTDSTAPNPDPRSPPYSAKIAAASPYLTLLFSEGMMLWTAYDGLEGQWEFKFPWTQTQGDSCDKWLVESSPPAIFFGCGAVAFQAAPGSNQKTVVETSGTFGAGEGGPGISVWSEIQPGPPPTSRIMAWSPGGEPRELIPSMAGLACGLAVSDDQIVGIRSGGAAWTGNCHDQLDSPQLWRARVEGGTVESFSLGDVSSASFGRVVASGDFAAVLGLAGPTDLPQAERSNIWLIRWSDGKVRRFVPSPGYEWRGLLLSVDDTYLYIGENRSEFGFSINKIIRYRLDRFDEIGIAVE